MEQMIFVLSKGSVTEKKAVERLDYKEAVKWQLLTRYDNFYNRELNKRKNPDGDG